MDSHRLSKDEAILTSVAESIGATLGTIAAKAGAVQKAITAQAEAVVAPKGRAAGKNPKKRTTSRRKRTGPKSASAARRIKRKTS